MLDADLDDLRRQVRDLTDRVGRLESALALHPEGPLREEAGTGHVMPVGANNDGAAGAPTPETTPSFAILGRATLGLAGAYLLRAIAEAGVLPSQVIFATGTLYAVAWLLWAAQVRAGRRLASTLYGLTAAFILSPLLWEATVRFHTINPWQAGVILVAFTVIGLAVSGRGNLLSVAIISTLAGIGTAGALLAATYDALPFTFACLAIAAAVETCACLDHWPGGRWLAALAADLSVLLATWLVTNPRGLPEGYAPIPATGLLAAQMLLLAVYIASVTVRTLFSNRAITSFETGQCVLAFLLGIGGALRLSGEGSRLTVALAVFALLCGVACYVISFKVCARQGSNLRNFYTYSAFGFLLVLVGCRLLLPGAGATIVWSLLAVACIAAGRFWGRRVLEIHGGVYLLLALLLSGALSHSTRFLLGRDTWPATMPAALWAGAVVAGVSYLLVVGSARSPDGGWGVRAFRVAMAAAVVWLVLGLAAGGLTGIYHGLFAVAAGDSYCATLRTGAVVGVTLLLAWAGSRLGFQDLAQLVYPLMLLGGYRLLTDDLHQERKAALFLSLLLYGAALLAIPRLRRARAA